MNAVYELITRDARGPSVRVVYIGGVILGLLVTAFLTWETLFRSPEAPTVGAGTYTLAALALLILPTLIAAISGTITAEFTSQIDFALLRTTLITPTQIVVGFVRGALFHSRVFLALSLPLLPLVAIGLLQDRFQTAYLIYVTCTAICLDLFGHGSLIDFTQFPVAALKFGATFAAAWVSALPAAAIGVYVGLNSRNMIISPVTAFLTTAVGPVLVVAACAAVSYSFPSPEELVVPYFLTLAVMGYIAFELTCEKLAQTPRELPFDHGGPQ